MVDAATIVVPFSKNIIISPLVTGAFILLFFFIKKVAETKAIRAWWAAAGASS
jgi:hypothetical protein